MKVIFRLIGKQAGRISFILSFAIFCNACVSTPEIHEEEPVSVESPSVESPSVESPQSVGKVDKDANKVFIVGGWTVQDPNIEMIQEAKKFIEDSNDDWVFSTIEQAFSQVVAGRNVRILGSGNYKGLAKRLDAIVYIDLGNNYLLTKFEFVE
jgi:hypothetical protein